MPTDSWPPLYLSPVPADEIERGDGDDVIATIEALVTVSKDGFAAPAGTKVVLRAWQKELIRHLRARRKDGRLRHRIALIGMPRKNGKSALASGLALDALLFSGKGAEVYSAAAEKEQARIVYGEVKRTIEADAELLAECNPMKDVIEHIPSGSIYRCLSAEAYSKEGLNISAAIVDELHAHPTEDLWNVLTLASAARVDPMVVAITTAGIKTQSDGRDTICYRLYKHGIDVANGLVDDPSYFFAWWGAPDGADHKDPKIWALANPGYGDLIDPEDFASSVLKTPENEFRTKRLNQWTEARSAWLPAGSWDSCGTAEGPIPAGARVVLGFDGSRNNDSTALMAVSVDDEIPVVQVVDVWEKPSGRGLGWQVPVSEVEEAIREAATRWNVAEVSCDPWGWSHSFEILEGEGLPMVGFPQSDTRMVPATDRLYKAIVNQQIAHDGDQRLARHVANAVEKATPRGGRIAKESRQSNRKVDLVIALAMAFDRAATYRNSAGPSVWSIADLLAEEDE